jgi:glycosyltransferase involved in cell wall biosynthesis
MRSGLIEIGSLNMEKGMVSVIIPCFNGEDYIAAAVESALGQSYDDIEVVVVDDGSSDGSVERLLAYGDDPRFRLLRHDRNRGIPAARNTGISAARGEYIAFLDQDDIWEHIKLEKQMRVFEDDDGDTGLAFADIDYLYDVNCEPVRNQREMVPPGVNSMLRQEVQRRLFMCNFIPTITAVIPRRVIDEVGLLDEDIRGGADDHELFLRIAGLYRIEYCGETLAIKRIHERNYSDIQRMKSDKLYTAEKIAALYPTLRDLRRKRNGTIYESMGYNCCEMGRFPEALGFYAKSLKENPLEIATWLKLPGVVIGLLAGKRAQDAYFKVGKAARRTSGKLWRAGRK